MKLKKNTDVYELTDGFCKFLIKVGSKEGKLLTKALENVLGSPALDDYGDSDDSNKLSISRYRLSKNTKLAVE